jgi:hypothetical protein
VATSKTEITEIVTGLGMLGHRSLQRALEIRPAAVSNVTADHFAGLETAFRSGQHLDLFTTAWENGQAFSRATDGLRGRPPWSLEWKGSHRPPAYEQIPADLRVDHVYLISCKYGSKILLNSSPYNLFEGRLAIRESGNVNWFDDAAPGPYRDLYAAVRRRLPDADLPGDVTELTRTQRDQIRKTLPRRLKGEAGVAYHTMNVAVAEESVRRWNRALRTRAAREEMIWRLLRFQAAPYFILGQGDGDLPIRIRVATPWDVRNRYEFLDLTIEAGARRQAVVGWRATFRDRDSGSQQIAVGHVQIRWSHGKFGQVPEAKVYLDTPYDQVPGYFTLGSTN